MKRQLAAILTVLSMLAPSVGAFAENTDILDEIYDTVSEEAEAEGDFDWEEYNIVSMAIDENDGAIDSEAMKDAVFEIASSSGICGDNLTWDLGDDGTLTISGSGDMTNWAKYSEVPWYSDRSNIKTVNINDGVTSIGYFAFSGCESLSSISLPESLTSIGVEAFSGCESLSSINIPDSVTNIDAAAFSGCSSLSSINIPDSVTIIYDYTFFYCSSLRNIRIPNGVTNIGGWAFYGCSSLSSINIPSSATSIGVEAFAFCSSLSSINIPASVASMEVSVFDYCSSLISINIDENNTNYKSYDGVLFNKSMTTLLRCPEGKQTCNIPSGVKRIGINAFSGCSSLSSIIIPDGVVSIDGAAFYECSNLSSISLPDSLTSIDVGSFSYCSSLNNISIPYSITSIGENAFGYCSSLTSINVDENNANYKSHDGVLFNKSMTTLLAYPAGKQANGYDVPDNITSIGNFAFSGCDSLSSIRLPEGVTSIGDWAFDGCSNISEVYYDGTEEEWTAISIGSGNEDLICANINYAASETNIPTPKPTATPTPKPTATPTPKPTATPTPKPTAMPTPKPTAMPTSKPTDAPTLPPTGLTNGEIGIVNGTKWSFNNGVLTIDGTGSNMIDFNSGDETPWYKGRTQIKKVVVNNVSSIAKYAFEGLIAAEEVVLSDEITSIGDHAFDGCAALKTINIPEKVSGVGTGAFAGCSSLSEITLPKSVTMIGNNVFEGCTSLKSIVIPYIGTQQGSGYRFSNMFNVTVPDSLTSIVISNETRIGDEAFKDCASIEKIEINENVTSLGIDAFNGCKRLISFKIPDGITSIGNRAFKDCESAVAITVPDSVKSIGESAFDGCKKLKEINIPDGVKYLYNNTYRNCSSLTRIEIPVTVSSIGESVLAGCTSLIEVKVPFVGANEDPGAKEETSQGIFGYLFGCADNKDIPASVTKVEVTGTDRSNYIPKGAFRNCVNIMDIIIDGGRNILDGAFVNCRYLTNLYIPGSISSIGVNEPILEGCSNLETLTIPFIGSNRLDKNSETSVLGALFGYDDSDITGTLQYYDSNGSFHYYKIPRSLKNVSLLNQENIPDRAFMECDFIEKIAVVTGANMGERAFYHCASLKRAALPDDLRNIGEQSFAGCESLETINIPSKVKSIGESAFYNARSLKNVTMPDSITEIAEDIFNGTNLLSDEEINVMASNKGVITCSLGSAAYNYAVSNGIQTNVVDSSELTVKRTSTTVSLLSDGSYMFDVVNTCNMRGILNIELYNENTELISSKTRETGDDIEYRVQFTGIEMAGVEYARIYITDETGEAVSTEDELISVSGGEIPDIGESDLEMTYRNGEIVFSGTAYIRPGTVLIQAVYNEDGSLDRMNTYDVKDISEPISVENIQGSKFMLWSGMDNMRPLAGIIKAE